MNAYKPLSIVIFSLQLFLIPIVKNEKFIQKIQNGRSYYYVKSKTKIFEKKIREILS
jgi:hypothetical protein